MWNESGYGDQGGGYMATSLAGDVASPSQGRQANRSRVQYILPCTVAQLLNAEQDKERFLINGIEVHQVSLVGMIKSMNEIPTRLDLLVDDMTGPPIEVKQFLEENDDDRLQGIRENMYVHICGNIRSLGDKRSLAAFSIRPLTDMNYLTCHILEVIHSHMKRSQLHKTGSSVAPVRTDANHSMTAGNVFAGANSFDNAGLTPVQQQVRTVIQSCHDENGISIETIRRELKTVSIPAIKDAVEFLSGEGHIYSTVDDEHYKSTDA